MSFSTAFFSGGVLMYEGRWFQVWSAHLLLMPEDTVCKADHLHFLLISNHEIIVHKHETWLNTSKNDKSKFN